MHMGPITMRFSAFLIIFLAMAAMKPAFCVQQRRSVEVRIGGDDGYTLRLRDALERAFSRSPKFRLCSGKMRCTLLVTIPHSVKWKRMGVRTQVSYDVEFSTIDAKFLEKSNGSCWEDDLDTCAASIVRSATDVTHKIH